MTDFDPICRCGDPLSKHTSDSGSCTVCDCLRYVGATTPEESREMYAKSKNDPVRIPAHYTSGTIEVANFIADQNLEYPFDNIVKYVARAGKKEPDKKIQDIEKAAAYLQMAHNIANGLPAVVRDPETNEVVWTLFRN